MLKWVVGGVAFLALTIALFLFSREGPDMSRYTDLHRATALELTDLGSRYRVVYEYTYDGQTFYGRTTIYSKSMESGSEFSICVDPADPSQHAGTYTDCGPGGPGSRLEGLKEKPEL